MRSLVLICLMLAGCASPPVVVETTTLWTQSTTGFEDLGYCRVREFVRIPVESRYSDGSVKRRYVEATRALHQTCLL